jgi:hypothetical protein
MGGIVAARGRPIIMGDADDSYDFLDIPRFVEELRQGYDLAQACRLPAGGGRVMPDAMPFLHRRWGNLMFSVRARRWFNAPIHDVYCGLRGFTKDLQQRLHQRCTDMEFATEMIIKSSLYGVKIAEVPIILHPDGRQSHAPHPKTFRDSWHPLRFFLMYYPRWLFLIPGAVLAMLSLAVKKWRLTGFGNLNYRDTLRWVVPGATLTALGVQTMFSSFFVSIIGMSRRSAKTYSTRIGTRHPAKTISMESEDRHPDSRDQAVPYPPVENRVLIHYRETCIAVAEGAAQSMGVAPSSP